MNEVEPALTEEVLTARESVSDGDPEVKTHWLARSGEKRYSNVAVEVYRFSDRKKGSGFAGLDVVPQYSPPRLFDSPPMCGLFYFERWPERPWGRLLSSFGELGLRQTGQVVARGNTSEHAGPIFHIVENRWLDEVGVSRGGLRLQIWESNPARVCREHRDPSVPPELIRSISTPRINAPVHHSEGRR